MTDILTPRLRDACSYIPDGEVVFDVGADRGLLVKALSSNGFKTYACENKKGPYLGLLESTIVEREKGSLSCFYSDGIDILPSDVTLVSLLGMGGNTIYQILSKEPKKLSKLHYILIEPQSDFSTPITYLYSQGFQDVKGKYVFEKRYYPLLLLKNVGEIVSYDEVIFHFGRIPLESKDPLLYEYLIKEFNRILTLPTDIQPKKKKELQLLKKGLAYYERTDVNQEN